jgi:hypothetical protein
MSIVNQIVHGMSRSFKIKHRYAFYFMIQRFDKVTATFWVTTQLATWMAIGNPTQ